MECKKEEQTPNIDTRKGNTAITIIFRFGTKSFYRYLLSHLHKELDKLNAGVQQGEMAFTSYALFTHTANLSCANHVTSQKEPKKKGR